MNAKFIKTVEVRVPGDWDNPVLVRDLHAALGKMPNGAAISKIGMDVYGVHFTLVTEEGALDGSI